tara:strand:+ start:162 stop:560 length:399 start_codon:yes stop_codon:yes gene_type:complete
LLERSYGSIYFPDEKGKRVNNILEKKNLFKTIYSDDRTFDYYYVSVNNKHHFGYPGSFKDPTDLIAILAVIISPWIYPFLIYLFLYDKLGLWMWQFDGKYHPIGCDINKCKLASVDDRPVSYYYFVLKKNLT